MKKQKHKTIKLGFFPIYVEAYIGGTTADAARHFKKNYHNLHELEDWIKETEVQALGRTFMHFDYQTCLLWIKSKDPAVIAHEAVHIAFFTQQKLGGVFSVDQHETCTYMVEHIVREVMK